MDVPSKASAYRKTLELHTMRFFLVFPLLVLVASVQGQGVTYHADVAPIIHENCTQCHRLGEIGPMPFTSFEEVSAYGEFIEYVTSTGYMPPWTPDPTYSHFVGERVLSAEEIETLSAWVDAGKPEGNPADNPGLPDFPEDSQVGDPDLVMPMPAPYVHEGSMTDQYQVFVLPTGFETDMTIRSLEVMPGNHAIAHHAILGIDISGTAASLDAQDPDLGYESFGDFGFDAYENFFGGWVPGTLPVVYPEGIGRVIPAGSDLLVQMHYGPSAVEESDQTEINVFFTEGPVEREVTTGIMGPWTLGEPFFIPANQVKVFHGEFPISSDISLINIVPHCHLIGASWEVFATSADGNDTIPLISIPDWDFNWQGFFTFPTLTKIPAGYTLEAIAVYDNTADNPFNPSSPPQNVFYGDNTEDEMFFVFLDYVEYQEGDEDISLETPLLTGIGALDPSGPLVKLQPNPNRGSVQLLVDPSLIGQPWEVLDLGGRILRSGAFRSANQQLDLAGLGDGVYLFRSTDGVERLVIQR